MRQFLLSLFLCVHVIGWGQTDIGGVVDISNYYKVTNIDFNKSIVTVSNAQGLSRGDRIMIVQMKGATISPSNNATSGQVGINNYGGAGTYEIADVCKVNGNNVTLVHNLKNTSYNFQSGKVQVVKVLKYESAIVTSTLEPSPWDGEVGGVLALSVSSNLQLNANVSADGKGFRGGKFLQTSGAYCANNFAPNYYYDPTPFTLYYVYSNIQLGAYKGESIVDLNISYQGGRAAVANGGGGGNNHNNGGGGGSNLAKGGVGGGNASPSGDACQGNYPGQGGYALMNDQGKRVFLGGGGGAGHANNPQVSTTGGGNGGGIIFIEAGTIITGFGKKISSNGLDGSSTLGDGASGGGGAGTIILNVGAYSGSVNIEAKGGKGGTEDENENPAGRCFGEGGGGSGGVIYFKGNQPAGNVLVAGGEKGDKLDSECPNSNLAVAGSAGVVVPNYAYVRSTDLSNTCPEGAFLPVVILSFKVTQKGSLASAEWSVAYPEDAARYVLQRKSSTGEWVDISTVPAEERVSIYRKTDGPLATGTYLYRLKIVEKDRSVAYSPVQQVTIKAEDINRLLIHPNPATSEITIVTPVQDEEWLNIYDMKSRLVYRKRVAPSNSVIRQDISFLSEGVYMIQVGKFTARFVVFK